jgi:SET domain-containing protein
MNIPMDPLHKLQAIYIARTPSMGLGVFTGNDISKGAVLEISPVIVMSAEERKLLDQTLLHDYIFEWGEDHNQCCMALGYVALYNHSSSSNCEYEMDYDKKVMSIVAVRDIKAEEELFINYNGDWNDERGVWFRTNEGP